MNHGTALWKDSSTLEDFGKLSLSGDGTLTLETPTGSAELALVLSTSPFADIYATPTWICAVGAAARQLVLGHAAGPSLEVTAELDRLDRGGRYDPGAHVVRFHDRPGHDDHCVLTWEIGVALLGERTGVAWATTHGDINQRVVEITAETVELMGVDTAISIALADGTARERPVGRRR